MGTVSRYPIDTPSNKPVGSVMTATFTLNGQRFMALNGGPAFKFNEAISMVVECEDQGEMDHYYEKLSAVPEAEQCGWCKDKYGLSWQIVHKKMEEVMSAEGEAGARAMQAMLNMKRLDVAELEKAAMGE
jgi:predicted 3-demethylubiquinone-9 3-methyltransferase (glyoxalase superfamily)